MTFTLQHLIGNTKNKVSLCHLGYAKAYTVPCFADGKENEILVSTAGGRRLLMLQLLGGQDEGTLDVSIFELKRHPSNATHHVCYNKNVCALVISDANDVEGCGYQTVGTKIRNTWFMLVT